MGGVFVRIQVLTAENMKMSVFCDEIDLCIVPPSSGRASVKSRSISTRQHGAVVTEDGHLHVALPPKSLGGKFLNSEVT
jgi:hypothetical protein